MYETLSARPVSVRRAAVVTVVACTLAIGAGHVSSAVAQVYQSPSLVMKISGDNNKIELTTNTSRILTLDKNVPRVQVNNPDLLAVTPLSATQVQISAKKAGVTQVNLWDEDGKIYTVDVLIYGDVAELDVALRTQFPNSSIRVYRYSESLVLKGFVDQPEHVSQIVQLASDYAPKVINNITVGGVQQVLLKVRVMEISHTKLRSLGVDWAYFGGSGDFAINSVGALISEFSSSARTIDIAADSETFSFGIVDGANNFFGVLEALEQNNIAKILAEPNIVAVSGRPAQFNVGGEVPIVIPQSLGTSSIEFKKFGTQVDFLPIVLGNGNIRLEVRPRVSSLDPSAGIDLQDIRVPGFKVREVDTAVEMKAGQTFALAGLVQERTESQRRGLPYISNLPIIGVPFRSEREEVNEVELLIMVTPEFVDAIEPHEVPCGGPGYATTSPDNCGLYCAGHLEVPAHCNPIRGMTACGECGGAGGADGICCDCGSGSSVITDGVSMPGGTGYDDSYTPVPMDTGSGEGEAVEPDVLRLPPMDSGEEMLPQGPSAQRMPPAGERSQARSGVEPHYTVPRPYNPPRVPVYVRNASSSDNRNAASDEAEATSQIDSLFGPVGYDPQ